MFPGAGIPTECPLHVSKGEFVSPVAKSRSTTFRSPRRTLPHIQDYFNRKGLISVRGEKKKAFYVMQDFYRMKANPVE